MKYVLLGFLLLIMNPVLGADEDVAPVARIAPVRVVCREIGRNGEIEITDDSASYTHSFSLETLEVMNREQINTVVVYLLGNASTIDGLSDPQKAMIAILAGDTLQVDAIVKFLLNRSRRVDIPALVLPHSPPWGK